MPGAPDEPAQPSVPIENTAREVAEQLLRTADLAEKLDWREFDFEVDLYDPLLDDLEGLLGSGSPSREEISGVFMLGMNRHVTPAVRLKLLHELSRRSASEVRLDVRAQARMVMRALHHLTMPASSMGLIWHLYPAYMLSRLKARREAEDREETGRPSEEVRLEESLAAGSGEPAALRALSDRAVPIVERLTADWRERPPADLSWARTFVETLSGFPGRRAARALAAILWGRPAEGLAASVRAALTAMPEPASEILYHHIAVHDPEPDVRRELFLAALELKDSRMLPLVVLDAAGAGPWSRPQENAGRARELLDAALRTGDRRSVPVALLALWRRPPRAELRAVVVEAFRAGPMASEFDEGLRALEAGRPVVVPGDMNLNEFVERCGAIREGMAADEMAAEMRRLSTLWESCYHERLDWRRPRDASSAMGPRERELMGQLEEEARAALGRLAGSSQVAELEREFRMNWLVTPRNDITGRIPLAIILDERRGRTDAESNRRERESEAAELYSMACRAHELKMDEEARRFAAAVLQIQSGHPFAKDFLERLDRAAGVPGIDEGSEAESAPRIIMP